MVEKKLLEYKIKNKIRQLLKVKKIKITQLSADLGYNKSFLSNIFHQEGKFFNLEHIEKICGALNYPVAKLFEDDVCSPKEAPPSQSIPKTSLEEALLEMFRGLSPQHRGGLIGYAEELRLTEVMSRRETKKVPAAQ